MLPMLVWMCIHRSHCSCAFSSGCLNEDEVVFFMTTCSSTIEYTFLPPRGPPVTSFFKLTICLNSGAWVQRERRKVLNLYINKIYIHSLFVCVLGGIFFIRLYLSASQPLSHKLGKTGQFDLFLKRLTLCNVLSFLQLWRWKSITRCLLSAFFTWYNLFSNNYGCFT